jgi:hypothetical protein
VASNLNSALQEFVSLSVTLVIALIYLAIGHSQFLVSWVRRGVLGAPDLDLNEADPVVQL